MNKKIDPRVWEHNFAMEYQAEPLSMPDITPTPPGQFTPDSAPTNQPSRFQDAPVPTVQPPSYGPQVKEPQKTIEITPQRATGTSATLGGAFYNQYLDGGDTMLQGGSINGGNGGSHTFADYKVIDSGTGPVEAAGTILFVKVECEATIANSQMLPGCKVTTAGLHAWDTDASDLPDNHSFTTAAATGFIYYEIGRWTDDAFLPTGGGNLLASGCIGDFHIARA